VEPSLKIFSHFTPSVAVSKFLYCKSLLLKCSNIRNPIFYHETVLSYLFAFLVGIFLTKPARFRYFCDCISFLNASSHLVASLISLLRRHFPFFLQLGLSLINFSEYLGLVKALCVKIMIFWIMTMCSSRVVSVYKTIRFHNPKHCILILTTVNTSNITSLLPLWLHDL
jgi:hypothetical protein